MEKILVFYQKDDKHLLMSNFDCSIYVDNSDFHVVIGAESIDDFIHNEEIHKKIRDNCGEKFTYLADNNKNFKEFFKNIKRDIANDNYADFFNQFDIIEMDFDVLNGLEGFLESSKEYLKDKKILIPFLVSFSAKKLEETKNYCAIVRNILTDVELVCAPYDQSVRYYVDVQDYYDAYSKREDLLNLIRSLNFSPLEEIAFIYDYLKGKKYQREEKGEPWYLSRGIISVLIGDKIVCKGYTTLFKSLVEELGHAYVEIIDVKKCGSDEVTHERVMIYVKDDKYGIDGNYIFDVTYDAKIKEAEEVSNNYRFFLRTVKEMNKVNIQTNNERVGLDILDWEKIVELMEKLPNVYTKEDFNRIIRDKRIDHNTILINMHMDFFRVEKKDNKKKDILEVYKYIYESFNRAIDYRKIIELFYNVRKIEYYLDPENVSFTLEDLVQMSKNYLAPNFAQCFGLIEYLRDSSDVFLSIEEVIEQFIRETLPNVEEDIARVKFTRCLKEYSLKMQ